MASKHLFPGHQFSARRRKWTPRLKVTEDSLRLMVCRVQSLDHCCNQSKFDVTHMENVAVKAAALTKFGHLEMTDLTWSCTPPFPTEKTTSRL